MLVDGPQSGVPRQAYRLNNLQLTKFRLNFPFHAPTRVVRKAWAAYNLKEKWELSAWSKKAKGVQKVSKIQRTLFILTIMMNPKSFNRNCRLIQTCRYYFKSDTHKNRIGPIQIEPFTLNMISFVFRGLHWTISIVSSCDMPKSRETSCWLSRITL